MTPKKKRKPTRQQMKEQRSAAIERKRQEQGWAPVQTAAARSRQDDEGDIIDDMLPLLSESGDFSTLSDAGMEQLMRVLVASGDLADEPELESIFVSPLDSAHTFAEVGEELGVDPASLAKLPDEEREEIQLQIMEGAIGRLLTDELREEILKALNDLRLRLKRAGKPKDAARAATLQAFLSEMRTSESWTMAGVVRAVFQRSMEAGFEIMEATVEDMEDDSAKGIRSSLLRRLTQPRRPAKADALVAKIPGLTGYMERQADKIWDEGTGAIYAGDLCLEIFSLEELEGGLEILIAVSMDDSKAEAPEGPHGGQLTDKGMKALKLRLDSYIAELFTPQRFEQLTARLNTVLEESVVPRQWGSIVVLLIGYARDEDAWDHLKGAFLPRALMGEMRAMGRRERESEGEGERKDRQE